MRKLDPGVAITAHHRDGAAVAAKTALLTIEGDARAMLAAERVALNFLGHLSGIATADRRVRQADRAHQRARLLHAQDHARPARAGEIRGALRRRVQSSLRARRRDPDQGQPHRGRGRHRGGARRAKAVAGHLVKIEIEVDTLDQLREVLTAGGADVALLDNMSPADMRKAVELVAGRLVLEASGGITLETAAAIAETGVDYLSSGAITHSAPNLDVALDIEM